MKRLGRIGRVHIDGAAAARLGDGGGGGHRDLGADCRPRRSRGRDCEPAQGNPQAAAGDRQARGQARQRVLHRAGAGRGGREGSCPSADDASKSARRSSAASSASSPSEAHPETVAVARRSRPPGADSPQPRRGYRPRRRDQRSDGAGRCACAQERWSREQDLVASGLVLFAPIVEEMAKRPGLESAPSYGSSAAWATVCTSRTGTPLCTITGGARVLLTLERTLPQLRRPHVRHRDDDVAIRGGRACRRVPRRGCSTRARPRRGTAPGKVRRACGGGDNHRMGLYDAVLIKDNHIVAAGGIGAAVRSALAHAPKGIDVEVECDSVAQAEEAIAAGADRAAARQLHARRDPRGGEADRRPRAHRGLGRRDAGNHRRLRERRRRRHFGRSPHALRAVGRRRARLRAPVHEQPRPHRRYARMLPATSSRATELASELGVSRTAVWKHIAALEQQGFVIERDAWPRLPAGRNAGRADGRRDRRRRC